MSIHKISTEQNEKAEFTLDPLEKALAPLREAFATGNLLAYQLVFIAKGEHEGQKVKTAESATLSSFENAEHLLAGISHAVEESILPMIQRFHMTKAVEALETAAKEGKVPGLVAVLVPVAAPDPATPAADSGTPEGSPRPH